MPSFFDFPDAVATITPIFAVSVCRFDLPRRFSFEIDIVYRFLRLRPPIIFFIFIFH